MILKVFSIFDSATGAFNQPFFMLTQAEAIRAFVYLANDPETNISKHPNDFHLFALGTYDNQTGKIEQETGHVDLGPAQQYKEIDNVVEINKEATA